jgi:hypothetical protein
VVACSAVVENRTALVVSRIGSRLQGGGIYNLILRTRSREVVERRV